MRLVGGLANRTGMECLCLHLRLFRFHFSEPLLGLDVEQYILAKEYEIVGYARGDEYFALPRGR